MLDLPLLFPLFSPHLRAQNQKHLPPRHWWGFIFSRRRGRAGR
uniref:Uncharacterized protein n=1 Tax=Inoviridae sp. ct0MH15 TaxID=2825775 RepID=A0A8S5VFH9_9VIRU|nr:MAG TPA: hypothetical protein [Inoviridae sp. ct0MH15]